MTASSSASLTSADHTVLQQAGIAPDKAEAQVNLLRGGMRHPKLLRAATPGDGIEAIDPAGFKALGEAFQRACAEGRWIHFIPASGAATRLAESLQSLSSNEEKLRAEGKDPAALRK